MMNDECRMMNERFFHHSAFIIPNLLWDEHLQGWNGF